MTQPLLCRRKAAAWTIPLVLCMATAFCGPHDESPPEQTTHAGAGIRAFASVPIAIATGTKAGYLPGTSAVTPAGEFTYRIPLDVPPGRAGVEPDLALAYASRAGNGLLGVGWDIDGFSEIQRCGKTFSQEGTSDGIDFDDDSLCLDGQKLVVLTAAQGVTEYRTEQDKLSRIVAYDAGAVPARFVVYRKDGRIREYAPITAKREDRTRIADDGTGTPTVTDVTLAWVLSAERDRAGNEMRYRHEVTVEERSPHALEHHPSAIEYTFQLNTKDLARRKVVFNYEERPDPTFAYVSGVKVQTTKRLRAIEMHAPNPGDPSVVWRYTLGYKESTTHRSLLAKVTKCGALGGCLLAKSFYYGHPSGPVFPQAHHSSYQMAETAAGAVHLVFDADGDGRDELLYEGQKGERYLRQTPSGGPPLSVRLRVAGDASFAKVSLKDSKPVDINADGAVELAGLIPREEVRIFGWGKATQKFHSVRDPIPISWDAARLYWPEPAYFVDLNGDSRPDLVKIMDMDPAPVGKRFEWSYWLNQGDSFAPPVSIPDAIQPLYCQTHVPQPSSMGVDLRGDQRGTLIVGGTVFIDGKRSSYCEALKAIRLDDSGQLADTDLPLKASEQRVFADLNGDGLRDWVGADWDGTLQVWWNTGLGFRRNGRPVWPLAADIKGEWHVSDIDADGDEDLWVMKGEAKPALILFRYVPNQVLDSNLHADMTNTVIEGIPPGYLGDFNGDGFLDVASRTDKGTLRVHIQIASVGDVLESIADESSDPRETITYLSSQSLPRAAQPRCQYPQRCIRHGLSVVRKHVRTGAGSLFYSYEDPRIDLRGRGFLGFGKVRTWDPDRGVETTTTYDHRTRARDIYPFALVPKEALEVAPILEQEQPGNRFPPLGRAQARVVKRVNAYQTRWLHEDRAYFVYPASWTSWEWEQEVDIDWDDESTVHIGIREEPPAKVLRKREGSFRFDDYGNVLEERVSTVGGVELKLASTYEVREGDWLVGLLHRREVTSSAQAQGTPPRVVEYSYDPRGLLVQVSVEPNHPEPDIPETMMMTRSPEDGLVSAVTRQAAGEAPRVVSIDYGDDERVFPRRVSNEPQHAVQFAYRPGDGTLGSVMDANGVQTRRMYDDLGRLRSIIPDGDAKITIDYELAKDDNTDRVTGHRVTVRDETGAEGFVRYDAWDRPVLDAHRGFDGDWIHHATEYDRLGNLAGQTRPSGALPDARTPRIGYRWDSLGRLREVALPDGARIRHAHSFSRTDTWDAENHQSYIERDADDRIVRSVQMLGSTELPTTYRYREFDLVDRIADPKGNLIELDYDHRGRRTRLGDPNTGTTTFSFNGFGELRQKADALGHVTKYATDVLGRISRITDADGVTELVWDASSHGIGKLSATTSPDGTRRQYHYDPAGRPEQLDWTVDGETFSVQMAYDALGRLSTLGYPEVPGQSRLTVRHAYNPTGYLAEVADVSAATAKSLWRVDRRNLDDALLQGTYGNGLVAERSYDDLTGRLKELNGGSIYALAYSYDANGLVKSRADSVKARSETFQHDALRRLRLWHLEGAGGTRDTEYDFDELGNLAKVLVNGQTTEENQYGGSGAGPHALTASSLHGSFTYDDRGRRTNGRGQHIEYTEIDLPRGITTPTGTTTFGYDASGTRVKKAGPSGTTISIGGLYERRTDAQGGRKHVFYIQGSEGVVAQIVHDQRAATTETQYILKDALGSVGVVTDEAGKEIDRRYFEPFGQRIDEQGAALSVMDAGVRLGFTGHLHDSELGLIDMRGRMYDPVTHRFLTPDPLVPLPLFGQSYNSYSYALNNPINLVDPTGYGPDWSDGLIPGWVRDHVRIAPGSGGSKGFFDSIGDAFKAIGNNISGLFRSRPSGASHQAKPLRHYARPTPPPYTDKHSKSLPSTGSAGTLPSAGPTFAQLVSYQEDSADPQGGAAAEQAEVDAFAEAIGVAAGTIALAALAAGPAGAPVAAIAGAISAGSGLYQLHRGVETGDPERLAHGWLNSIPLLGGISRGGRLATGLRAAARGAAVVPRSAAAAESAFSIASRGGRHAGFLTRARGMTRPELERAARSFQRGIERHEGFLQNPSSHVPNWSSLRPEHQQRLLQHWQHEITTFSEQQSIVHELLR